MRLISEIGSNHNNDWERCKKLILKSKECGFSGVKFQLFDFEKLYQKIDPIKKLEYKKNQLSLDWIPKIADFCKQNEIQFGISPFYDEAIQETCEFVDFFKISSFDMLRKTLIEKCVLSKKDVFFSCGLITGEELRKIIFDNEENFLKQNKNYYFMHCVSRYPALWDEACLNRILELKKIISEFQLKNIFCGYSDHTNDIDVITQTLIYSIDCIEMHFDLDDLKGFESYLGHCWTPTQLQNLFDKFQKILQIKTSEFNFSDLIQSRADSITGLRGNYE